MSFYNEKWFKPWFTPSLARVLLSKTPDHAKRACPYYGGGTKPTAAMIEGIVVDALVLGGDPDVTVLDVPDFRTKEAKRMRDETRNPIKIDDYRRCEQAAKEILAAATGLGIDLAGATVKERLFWDCCSTEPDLILADGAILDLKRTAIAPTGDNWRRHVAAMRYHIAAAAACEATGADRYGWWVVEASPPHLSVVHWASPELLKIGARDWAEARDTWFRCVETGIFPAYNSCVIEPAAWMLDRDESLIFSEGAEDDEPIA